MSYASRNIMKLHKIHNDHDRDHDYKLKPIDLNMIIHTKKKKSVLGEKDISILIELFKSLTATIDRTEDVVDAVNAANATPADTTLPQQASASVPSEVIPRYVIDPKLFRYKVGWGIFDNVFEAHKDCNVEGSNCHCGGDIVSGISNLLEKVGIKLPELHLPGHNFTGQFGLRL